MYLNRLLLLVLISSKFAKSAKILAIMPTPSYSHQIAFNPLWLALTSKGHQVTLLTTDPIKTANSENLRQIDWSFAYKLWHDKHNLSEIIKNFNDNLLMSFKQYVTMMNDIADQELSHPEVRQMIRNGSEHFDLVIAEFLHPVMLAFGKRFGSPVIGVSPMDITSFGHNAVGNPTSPAVYSDFIMPYDSEMTFWERIANSFFYVVTKAYFKHYFYPKADEIVKKHFWTTIPRLEDIQRNLSSVFLNVNPILHDIRPLMPNVVMVGGGNQIKTTTYLPTDIREFLDGAADQGAIYFSMGTNVKSQDLPIKTKTALLEAFSELPYKVLWKFEDLEVSKGNSKVLIKKWMPQAAILSHPSIKLFITQGGLQSIEEAVYSAVPIVGMPVYVDQYSNIRRMVKRGFGVQLSYSEVKKSDLKKAITEVINNIKYKKKAEELSDLLKTQPLSGLDEAVWWVEYVIKHRGQKLFKPSQLPLYQYLMLDVAAFLILILGLILWFSYKFPLTIIATFKKLCKLGKTVKLK